MIVEYVDPNGYGATDHGLLTGLGDDDHSLYLLASDATSRAAFAANWLDLTDGGVTSLHSHAGNDSSSVRVTITQAGHGFSAGDCVLFGP